MSALLLDVAQILGQRNRSRGTSGAIMPTDTRDSISEWGDESWAILEAALSKLEDAWRRASVPNLHEFLPIARHDPRYPSMLVRLIAVDQEWWSKRGVTRTAEDYLVAFPELQANSTAIAALKAAVDARNASGSDQKRSLAQVERSSTDSSAPPSRHRALRIICPHCLNHIEIFDEELSGDLPCPVCGSSFDLRDGGAPLTDGGRRLKRQIAHFEFIEQLGSGAFGSVWKALDRELDRIVAVKIPRYGRLDPKERERFVREARAAAQLRHPNIVGVQAVGIEADQLYIVSDYIDGIPLNEWMVHEHPSTRQAAEVCAQIAAGIHHAHEQQVVHRDLKPHNIIIDCTNQPHITDFGLAKRGAGEVTMTLEGQIIGTAAYLSPEQARGESHAADRRSDVYSLGVILFELITGELPFRGTVQMLLRQHAEDDAPSLRKLDGSIHRDLETICLKSLEKEPVQRYQSAGDFEDDLRRFLRNEFIHARPISKSERVWRWCRRNRLVTALTGSLFFTMAIGTAASMYLRVQAQQNATHYRLEYHRANKQTALARLAEKRAVSHATAASREAALVNWHLATMARDHEEHSIKAATLFYHAAELFTSAHDSQRSRDALLAAQSQAVSLVRTLPNDGPVTAASFSRDGSRILTLDAAGTQRLWDPATGRQLCVYRLKRAKDALFVDDDTRVLTWNRVGHVQWWDTATGKRVKSLDVYPAADIPSMLVTSLNPHSLHVAASDVFGGRLELRHIAADVPISVFDTSSQAIFNFDGTQFLLLKPGELRDSATGTLIRTFADDDTVSGAVFSSDGSYVLTWASDRVRLWKTTTGEHLQTFPHDAIVNGAAFNEDDSCVLTWGAAHARLWNTTTARRLYTLSHDDTVSGADFSSGGSYLLTWASDRVRLWKTTTGEHLQTFPHDAIVNGAVFSDDDSYVLTWGDDCLARIWTTLPHSHVNSFAHPSTEGISLNYDGSRLLTWDFKTFRLWDTETGKNLKIYKQDEWRSGELNGDGSRILTRELVGFGEVRLKDADTGNSITNVLGKKLETDLRTPDAIFSTNGLLVVSWNCSDRVVPIYDSHSGRIVRKLVAGSAVCGAEFTRDDMCLLTWGVDRAQLWDTTSGRLLHTFRHTTGIKRAQCTKSAGYVLTCGDERVSLWDARTGHLIRSFVHEVLPVATVSSGGTYVATWSRLPSAKPRIWDTKSGQSIETFDDVGEVDGAAFIGDTSRLLMWGSRAELLSNGGRATERRHFGYDPVVAVWCSDDSARVLTKDRMRPSLRLWDGGNGELLYTREVAGPVKEAVFSRDGSRAAYRLDDGSFGVMLCFVDDRVPLDERRDAWQIRSATAIDPEGRYGVIGFHSWLSKTHDTCGHLPRNKAQ